ncbi:uncharacterized protein J4E92_002083 [Alternaria infectoria]|uniref:uncharacterized protein n=1 Tax=Alternaria infectoria TaxID=45303 RepID=UPI002220A731|nr:uncharacterized protein J4E92_002083 [Alternaria infectoria]KAI4937353.1 hypothetical protein J4E92_002083 [Alternaria infectoria]
MSVRSLSKAFYTLGGMIHEERSQCFTFFGNTDQIRIMPGSPKRHAVEFFTLVVPDSDKDHTSFHISVRWKLINGKKELFIHRYGAIWCSWLPARQWLRQYYGTTVRKTALWLDYVNFSGQKFPFMRLPAELRQMVFEAVVGPVLWPRKRDPQASEYRPIRLLRSSEGEPHAGSMSAPITCQERPQNLLDPRLVWPSGLHVRNRGTSMEYASAFCRSARCSQHLKYNPKGSLKPLLLVSKAFGIELQQTTWQSTTKHYYYGRDIIQTIPRIQILPFNSLRRISLKMSNLEYFRLLGYGSTKTIGFAPITTPRLGPLALEMLMGLDKLQFLEFGFITGRSDHGHREWADPWSTYPLYEVSCQAEFVDWFFTLLYAKYTAAKSDTRLIPHVTFTGHVKHITRAHWEPIWRSLKWGVRHDFSSKIETIISTPVEQL